MRKLLEVRRGAPPTICSNNSCVCSFPQVAKHVSGHCQISIELCVRFTTPNHKNQRRRSSMFSPPASRDLFILTAKATHVKCDVRVQSSRSLLWKRKEEPSSSMSCTVVGAKSRAKPRRVRMTSSCSHVSSGMGCTSQTDWSSLSAMWPGAPLHRSHLSRNSASC